MFGLVARCFFPTDDEAAGSVRRTGGVILVALLVQLLTTSATDSFSSLVGWHLRP